MSANPRGKWIPQGTTERARRRGVQVRSDTPGGVVTVWRGAAPHPRRWWWSAEVPHVGTRKGSSPSVIAAKVAAMRAYRLILES